MHIVSKHKVSKLTVSSIAVFKHKVFFLFLIAFFTCEQGFLNKKCAAQTFTAHDYSPVELPRYVPDDVLLAAKGGITVPLPKDPSLRQQQFGFITNLELRALFLEGNVYYGDTMTAYIRKVFDKLLENDQPLRSKLHLFVTRFPTPNAITWQDGTILVNLGLIMRCKNEAQLAFILAHELTHYKMQHSLMAFVRDKNAQPKTTASSIAQIPYQDNDELVADSVGLVLLRKAGYNTEQAIRALELLEENSPPNPLNMLEMLNSDKSKLSKKDFCSGTSAAFYMASPTIGSNNKKTISIAERIKFLRRCIKKDDNAETLYFFGIEQLEYIKKVAVYENIENCNMRGDFFRGAYEALWHLQEEPQNRFFARKAAEALVTILAYSKNSKAANLATESKMLNEPDLGLFYCFLCAKPDNEIQQITFGVIEKLNNNFSEKDEDMLFYLAFAKEIYNGLDMTKAAYQEYLELFPKGRQAAYVKNRLNPPNAKNPKKK